MTGLWSGLEWEPMSQNSGQATREPNAVDTMLEVMRWPFQRH